jgi:phosphoglycerate kinase
MKLSYRDMEVHGRRVLVREDLNVPLGEDGVADDTRIRAAVPTLRDLADRGARVIVLSHLGRPRGRPVPSLSLRPVACRLSVVLGRPVAFAADCVGEPAETTVAGLADGEVLRTCASTPGTRRTTRSWHAGWQSSPRSS